MATRANALTIAVALALGTGGAARAGQLQVILPAPVVAPPASAGLEPDDLPAPASEAIDPRADGRLGAAAVELPSVPDFALPANAPPPVGPTRAASPGGATTPPAIAVDPPEPAPIAAPLRQVVDDSVREISVGYFNACNQANQARRFEAAIVACQAATSAWYGNHLAWYAEASAYLATQNWRDAAAAAAHAVALRPDRAMYQLYYGVALYEAVRQRARTEQARLAQRPPGAANAATGPAASAATPPADAPAVSAALDLSASQLGEAYRALWRAAQLDPGLWRAHYYLGRIYRERNQPRFAAEQLTQAITANPGYRNAYLALIELYQRWNYLDHRIAVAALGAARVAAPDSGDLWFELALAYQAKAAIDPAIAALDRAIAARPGDPLATLERGRLYLDRGDAARARRDLEAVAGSTDPRWAGARQLAAQLLARLAAAGSARDRAGPSVCNGSNNCHTSKPPSTGWGGEDPISRL